MRLLGLLGLLGLLVAQGAGPAGAGKENAARAIARHGWARVAASTGLSFPPCASRDELSCAALVAASEIRHAATEDELQHALKKKLGQLQAEPLAPAWLQRACLEAPGEHWERFYQHAAANFFKDRHLLRGAFPQLMPQASFNASQHCAPIASRFSARSGVIKTALLRIGSDPQVRAPMGGDREGGGGARDGGGRGQVRGGVSSGGLMMAVREVINTCVRDGLSLSEFFAYLSTSDDGIGEGGGVQGGRGDEGECVLRAGQLVAASQACGVALNVPRSSLNVSRIQLNVSRTSLQKLFSSIDRDKDGCVNYQDWLAFFIQNMASWPGCQEGDGARGAGGGGGKGGEVGGGGCGTA